MASDPHRSFRGTARPWRTLAALAVAVLLVHLWGLGIEPLRLGLGNADASTAPPAAPAPEAVTQAVSPIAVAPPRVRPVQVTQVAWLPAPPDTAPTPPLAQALPATALLAQTTPRAPTGAAASPRPTQAALPPSQPPASTRLRYDIEGVIKGLTYRASSTLDWTLDAGRYAARTEMSLFLVGTRVQTSEGTVGADGLRPERFSDKRRSELATHFEREAGRIRFSGNAPEAALMPGAQDRLSLFMQLAGLLQARPHQTGDVIEFQVAGTGDAEPWRFEVLDMQDLNLPAGTVAARWVRRLPRKPHDSTVEMWLAPSLNHLPVRLRISQANGDVADQRLTRLP